MPLRWLWAGLPLAVLVAVLAHLTAFGTGHAAGGAYATVLVCGLAFAFALRFGAKALRSPEADRQSFATALDLGKSALLLASVAATAFAAIEIFEGHDLSGVGLWPLLAVLPIALLTIVAARGADRLAERVGTLAAIYLRRTRVRIVAAFVRRSRSRSRSHDVRDRRVARGRAPPLVA